MVPPASAAERLRPDGDRRHRPRRVRLGRSRDGGAVVGLRGWSFAGHRSVPGTPPLHHRRSAQGIRLPRCWNQCRAQPAAGGEPPGRPDSASAVQRGCSRSLRAVARTRRSGGTTVPARSAASSPGAGPCPGAPPGGGPQTSGSAVACCGPGRGLANGGTRRSLRGPRPSQPTAASAGGQSGRAAQQPHGPDIGPAQTPRLHARTGPGGGRRWRRDHGAQRRSGGQRGAGQQGRHQLGRLLRGICRQDAARCARKSCSRDTRRRQAHHPDGCRWSRL